MSGRGWSGTAISDWSKGAFTTRYILAGLIVLICMACIPSIASADVDMTGKIAPGPALKSGLHGLGAEPLVNSEHDGVYHCSDAYSTIANVAGGLAIGNCPRNEELDVEDYGYGGEESGYFYGGYFANVGACAWVKVSEALKEKSGNLGHCSGGIGYEYGTFYSQINSGSVHDGFYVTNRVSCEEYANVYPWAADTATGPIRDVAPYTESHENAGYPALKWRYVTNNGKYVMVRDTTVGGGEGNWAFVERSCLPATLPSGSEKLPPKPAVYTELATGVATPDATLHASVNPNGVDTKYFFEYGTSESYGSYTTTEDAGAGTSAVPVSWTLTNLAPGTTYYYRIIASSAIGESEGGPVAFTTQPPPMVSTESASELNQVQAQLNGSVNPEGLDTHYHFEWGTTGSYGSSTSLGDAGAGTSSVHVSATVTGLEPDTTYHYRLVASSSAGAVDGGEYTFTTPYVIDAFYRGTTDGLHNTLWNGSYWSSGALGPENVMEGNPSAVALPEGKMDVFYRNKKAGLENAYWNGSAWSSSALGPENVMAGEPYALARPGGLMNVFYRNKKGGLENAYWNGSAWSFGALGPENVMEGNPSAVSLPEGKMDVFYRDKKGGMENAYFSGSWYFGALGPENVMEGNPSAVALPEGKMDVFFRNKTGGLESYYWSAAWYFGALGTEKIMAGDPGAATLPNGVMDVFYRNTSGAVQNAFMNLSSWSFGAISPEKTVAGEISAVDVL